ncbi:MAG: oligosaccharide flippase family protein [Candidatus Aminicenantes bacterium]|nr:oligosaccharide flippase family protein [Candidatus Aminicenantes bacterium]
MIKRVLSTSFHSIISRFFVTATNLFIVFFVSKNLGIIQLGSYGIVFFFFIFFATTSSMSLYLFFGKEIARYDKKTIEELNIMSEFVSVSLLGILLTIILPILFSLLYNKIDIYLLILSSVAGYFHGVERNLGGILLGKERMHLESFGSFISFVFVVIPMVMFGDYFHSIEMIFILRIFAFLIAILIKLWFLRDHFINLRLSFKLKFFKESKYYWFVGLSTVVLREIDILILSFFVDKSLLGAYFLALRIYYAFGILAEVVSSGLTPFISRFYVERESGGFNKFNKYMLVVFMFFAFVFSVSLLLSRNLIVTVFSVEFLSDAGKYLFYLSFILFFRFFSFSTGIILTSADAQRIRFNIMFIASTMLIFLDIVLGSIFKIAGVIISRAIIELFVFFVFGYFVNKIISKYNVDKQT